MSNKKDSQNNLQFFINGEKHQIENPDPSVLLVDYLRSTKIGLTGTKHACGQGGCGSCTVMLSYWDDARNEVVNASCNSCLRPLVALDGMEVTTIEGLGSVDTEISPVQYAIAKNNGSQCGYCTPGFVMNMHSLLIENQNKDLTKKEIEQCFDGNICRCTGFRPILYAMKTFASDWTPADEIGTPPCLIDPSQAVKCYDKPREINENDLNKAPRPLHFSKNGIEWFRPIHIQAVHDIMDKYQDSSIKLVCGNTSKGIPSINPTDPTVMIDISQIKELKKLKITESQITVGAATTYSEFLDILDKQIAEADAAQLKGLKALHYMAIRTAGKIVRNMASLAGNTMLVARNITSGYPFPSDLFVALAALETKLSISLKDDIQKIPILDFLDLYNNDQEFRQQAIIVAYHIPMTKSDDFVQTFKVALRLENSHSLANAGFKLRLDKNKCIKDAILIVGGIDTKPFRANNTEQFLVGKPLDATTMSEGLTILSKELSSLIDSLPQWFLDLPTEGVSNTYRKSLIESYFYKYFIEILKEISPNDVPAEDLSAPQTEFDRPVSKGTQHYSSYKDEFPVNLPIIKLSAFEQATGEAIYTHDIAVPVKGLQGAFVTSTQTLAKFHYHIPIENGTFQEASVAEVLAHVKSKFVGVVAFFTYRDIPEGGTNGSSDPYAPDPIFCVDEVTCFGQCIGLLVAEEEQTAINAANYLSNNCICYTDFGNIILDIREAVKANSIFPNYTQATDDNQKITAPNSDISWVIKTGGAGLESGLQYGNATINGVACTIVAGTQQTGDQIHFYMETQSCFSQPGEQRQMLINPSSQSPDSVQTNISQTLNISENNIEVDIKWLGGGYGGKTTRTTYVASPTALASFKLKKPVRVAMPRDIDTYMIGKRHPFLGEYNIAVVADGVDKGKIIGTVFEFYSNGGNTKDCSFDVMDCAILGADNSYNVPNFQAEGFVCKTNRSSNGAMRSYGGVQSGLITEEAIEAAAHRIGMLPEDIRQKNLYFMGDFTPYGQQLDYCFIQNVWEKLRKDADFDNRQKATEAFNKANKWKKRGISMIPLKYGLGYNLGFLMQGAAKIEVYASDGSVLLSHGGVEMGQGVMTKTAQIAAQTLNIPLSLIQMDSTRTSVIPNAIGTGATSSSDLNGGATKKACEIQRKKLEEFCMQILQKNGSKWCIENGINYWDFADGWQAMVTAKGKTSMIWNNVLSQAYMHRVDLSSQALYSTPGLADTLDQQFYGFTYSACCSEVEIDVLTGESNILRTDMLYDIGKSLNPAIDIGQIEGAFVMGAGYVLSEKVVWEPKGTANTAGMLNTPNTWTYKPPCAASIPLDLRIDLFPREDAPNVPENPNLLISSKGVGEPPLVLANTVFFAIKHAVLAARQDRGHSDWFEMESPATVENIRNLCAIEVTDLTF
jgi:xanthine dehydrogenase/oxidase